MNQSQNPNQSSLSRDFTLLSAIIVVLALIASAWLSYEAYEDHSQLVTQQLESEATRIDRTLNVELENAAYLLESLARQISRNNNLDSTYIAKQIKSFDSNNPANHVFSWIDAEQKLVASSNVGVLEKPIEMADRDYVKTSLTEPWKVQVGRPVEGRVTKRWIIPMAIGITDDTGKFQGSILISVDVMMLTNKIQHVINAKDLSFAIVSLTYGKVTQLSGDPAFVEKNFPSERLATIDYDATPRGTFSKTTPFSPSKIYSYYELSSKYPYIILVGHHGAFADGALIRKILPRMVQLVLVAAFLIAFLWIVRLRVIRPVIELSEIAATMARGGTSAIVARGGSAEIHALSEQIQKIGEHLKEKERVLEELAAKMVMLRKAKEMAELTNRVKVEFLASLSQELRNPLNSILGFSEVIKNQMYGPLNNPKYEQYVADIHHSSQQLLEVINDVLSLSKAESGMIEMVEKPIDCGMVLRKVTRLLTEKMAEQQINIVTVIGDSLPRLLIDELRYKQIIINLLNHAAKFTPMGRDISVSLQLEQDRYGQPQIVLRVKDGGDSTSPRVVWQFGDSGEGGGKDLRRKGKLDLGDISGLGIPLTKTLCALVGATLTLEHHSGKAGVSIVEFSSEKLVFWEQAV